MNPSCLIRVGIAVPLYDGFDYRVPDTMQRPAIGARVSVPFGRREKTGIVLAHPQTSSLDAKKIKPIHAVLDDEPILSAELLELLQWAARYYHHPIGEVLHQAIPQWLRQGRPVRSAVEQGWALTEAGHSALRDATSLQRAPKQAAALRLLAEHGAATRAELSTLGISADTLRRLADKALIESVDRNRPSSHSDLETPPELTADQQLVVDQVSNDPAQFRAYLLQGVTGSGKTEVYLRLIQSGLLQGLQSLLLVPEIGLTPQLVARLRKRFGTELAVLHSGLSDKERLGAWQRAHTGAARLVVGTRSAIFASLPQLGLIVVDEEHDASFKQQTGFRYNARDLAIVRARKLGIKVVLGSATPSLESLHNALTGRYALLDMPRRIGAGGQPRVQSVLILHDDRLRVPHRPNP